MSTTSSRRVSPWAWLNGPTRLGGVDLARALAIVGMFAAHLLTVPTFVLDEPATWLGIVDGRPSILFATLAGVSIALVSGGVRPVRGTRRARTRARLALRAAVIWLIGLLLMATGVPVYVILPTYALLFVLALPLLGLPARALWVLAVVLALVAPFLYRALMDLPELARVLEGDLGLFLGWPYPFVVWIAFLVAGLAAGRSDLGSLRTQIALVVGGGLISAVGYGADAVMTADGMPRVGLGAALTATPHESGLWEVLGSGGLALAVLGLCLLLCRTPGRWVVLPLRATGAMPLTSYVAHLVAWAVMADPVDDLMGFRATEPFWLLTLAIIAGCTAWALLIGRGPLERLLDRLVALTVRR